mmetsp:Transcript_83297/g.150249  ORF Transcript_83297/g.150249 Transcript_83297/m.150249 type:complete len:261 (+) Transcript_83297:353-1135(+)
MKYMWQLCEGLAFVSILFQPLHQSRRLQGPGIRQFDHDAIRACRKFGQTASEPSWEALPELRIHEVRLLRIHQLRNVRTSLELHLLRELLEAQEHELWVFLDVPLVAHHKLDVVAEAVELRVPPAALQTHFHPGQATVEELSPTAVQAVKQCIVKVGQLLVCSCLLGSPQHGQDRSICAAQGVVGLHVAPEGQQVPLALDVAKDHKAVGASCPGSNLHTIQQILCAWEVHGYSVTQDHVVLFLFAGFHDLVGSQLRRLDL